MYGLVRSGQAGSSSQKYVGSLGHESDGVSTMTIYIQPLFWFIGAFVAGTISGRLTTSVMWLLAFGARSPIRFKPLLIALLVAYPMTIIGCELGVLGLWGATKLHLLPARTNPAWPSLVQWLYTLVFWEFMACFLVSFFRSTHKRVRQMLSQISCDGHQAPRIIEAGHYGPFALMALAEWIGHNPKECFLVKPASAPVREGHHTLLRPVRKVIEGWLLLRCLPGSSPTVSEEAPHVVGGQQDETISK